MSTPHPVIGVLRAGMLLGLGWVVAAVVAWQAFGMLWALLLLFVWLILQRFFHRAVQHLGTAVAASARRDAPRPPHEETPR
ncbi:hypothetical protein GXW78_11795 [Roseomonas terrae]|uniref:Uncharacterized protein n=1 Tax=Neoroseomonas terrae TaxID=424799 RepID=A0ABS5EH67_9PROT|nr:hypothetical protein [Neoroseomonas terrae]MBR0650348.1 hypothetical protein [Neoroseomonas terrae]